MNGAAVSSTVALTVSSTDMIGVTGVSFYEGSYGIAFASSTFIASTSAASGRFMHSVNTSSTPNGSTTLWALSTDTSNNTSTATTTVNVQNPLVILNEATSTGFSTATIAWTTNDPASSLVNYGSTSAYGSSVSSSTLVTSHSIMLTGLAAATTYHFQIVSTNGSGATASTTDATILTAASVQVLGTTATQAVIAYTAPDSNPCTVAVSQSPSLAPLVPDVDPNIFAGSNLDNRSSSANNGTAREFVIGARTAELATAGPNAGVRHYSRALEALTTHYGQVTCDGQSASFTFTTTNIPLGDTYGDPFLSDATNTGSQPWPEALGGLSGDSFIDPLTGLYLQRISPAGNDYNNWTDVLFGSAFNQGNAPCDSSGPWTNPCGVLATTSAATVGASQGKLIVRPFLTYNADNGNDPWSDQTEIYGNVSPLNQLSVQFNGFVNSTNTAYRTMDICLSMNGGASCASSVKQFVMGQSDPGSSNPYTVGQASTTQFGVLPWLLDSNPRINIEESSPHSGVASVSGNTVTWVSGNPFSLYWVTGGNGSIRLSTNNDACVTSPASTTSSEYTIAGFVDGNDLTVSGTPPQGSNIYWCENNFAVMVWRDQMPGRWQCRRSYECKPVCRRRHVSGNARQWRRNRLHGYRSRRRLLVPVRRLVLDQSGHRFFGVLRGYKKFQLHRWRSHGAGACEPLEWE